MYSDIIRIAIKRDGREVPFDDGRIFSAITKAMAATELGIDEGLADFLTDKVRRQAESICGNDNTDSIRVDDIHNLVETALMSSSRKDAAQEYIRYREKRNLARKARTNEIFEAIINAQPNDITRENANMNADTPAGMMMKFASESSKTFVDECLLSKEVKEFVKENLLHIHDKDYYPTKSLTCIQHPLDQALEHGFVSGTASARPAKRIETAAVTACMTMETVQNEMHGGQAIPAFDFYLAPYVRKAYEEEVGKLNKALRGFVICDSNLDEALKRALSIEIYDYIACKEGDINSPCSVNPDEDPEGWTEVAARYISRRAINCTVKRVHQAMESFVHNMNNIHSRGGNQVVFSSINYGTDTSAEGRCIIREILNTTYEGVGNGETAIFPIQIWKKKRGVNFLPGDRNYDLYMFACKVSARRFFPNFLNLDASFNRDASWKADDPRRFEHEVATMGCRTRVYENRFGPRTSIGRGNLSFSTINLPGLALQCMDIDDKKKRLDTFFSKLEELLDVTALQLHQRFEFQASALAKQFPMLMSRMWIGSDKLAPDDQIRPVLNQGTLGIGFIGLAECLVALVGHHHGESEEAQQLGIDIVTFMRNKANVYCERYSHNYSILATPAEGLSGKFTRVDRMRWGIIPGVTDKEYYTNSNHVPVSFHCTPEQKARIESPYHALTLGGHIFYVEMDGDATHNPQAIAAIVELMDKYDIGYGSVNHHRVRCLDCLYETADRSLTECPRCGGHHLDVLQRITGYLVGTTDRWNSGKRAELRDRVAHQ